MIKGNKFVVFLMVAVLVISLVVTGCGKKEAQYPAKPIEVIIAFAAGGGTDVAARTVLKFAEKYAGTTFAAINKPGASGEIGFTAIATAPKDGYTIGMINPPTVLMHPIQRGNQVKYKLDDFEPIANIVTDPGVIVVKPGSTINSLQDLIAEAKNKGPGKLSIAYSGPGTSEALTLRRLEQMTGIELNKVPFDGTAPSVAALLGGHVDIMATNASEIYPQYMEKSVKVLAVGAEKKIKMMPDIPTYIESGVNLTQTALRGLAAPKGIDPKYRDLLAEAVKKTIEDPEFQKKAEEMRLPLDYMGPQEYKDYLKKMYDELDKEFKANPW